MRWVFLLLVSLPLCAEKLPQAVYGSPPEISNKQTRFPLSSYVKITPRVDVISGEYLEEACDLVVAGSQPLSVRRFYNHFASYHDAYNFWRFNPEHYCVANFSWKEQKCFAAIGHANGNITCFDDVQGGQCKFKVGAGFIHGDQNGQTHPLNISFTAHASPYVSDIQPYQWVGEIILGSGARRQFSTPYFNWLASITLFEYPRYRENPYSITAHEWTPYEVPVTEERLPNGNVLVYTYTHVRKHEDLGGYPEYSFLNTITAYNRSKTKVLGSLTFRQLRANKNAMVHGMEVIGSDGRKAVYSFSPVMDYGTNGRDLDYLSSVVSPHAPDVRYGVNRKGKITHVNHPDGREFVTGFDASHGKTIIQMGPVGTNGEMCTIGNYAYYKGLTVLGDAHNNATNYHFDASNRIVAIEICDKLNSYRIDRFQWDPATGNLLKKTVENAQGKILLKEEYTYDAHHNVIIEKCGDENESYSIYRTYSTDGFNLKLTEKDDYGRKIAFSYVPGTNLLAAEFLYEGECIRKRVFNFYDDCAILIKTILDDGKSIHPDDVSGVTFRKIMEITPRYEHPCFGLPATIVERTPEALVHKIVYTYTPFGKVSKEDHYDETGAFCYSIQNGYDAKERLAFTIDPLGQKTQYTYDANHNLITQTGPAPGMRKEWVYDKANRPIKEIEDGLAKEVTYDKLGQAIAIKDECGFTQKLSYDCMGRVIEMAFEDGAVERKCYDVLGRCLKESNSLKEATVKTYNFRGQVTSIRHPDGSEELFKYRPDGKLLVSCDKNGAQHLFSYDCFGNCLREEINGEKIKEAQFSAFFPLSSTDFEGQITTYKYDKVGRKIEETCGPKTTLFSYDNLGRPFKTQQGEAVFITKFDFLGRVVEKRTEDLRGNCTEIRRFAYDALGRQIQEVTSKGTVQTSYNNRGEVVEIKDGCGNCTKCTYEYKGGLVKKILNPKGIEERVRHDCHERPCEVTTLNSKGQVLRKCERVFDKCGRCTEELHHVYEGTTLTKTVKHKRIYGEGGQLLSLQEAEEKLTQYVYDKRGRVKAHVQPNGTMWEYVYDMYGRLQRFFSKDFDCTYTYDKCDRLLKVTDAKSGQTTTRSYDSLGNLLSETLANGLTLKSTYENGRQRSLLTLPDGSTIAYAYEAEKLKKISRKGLCHTYSRRDWDGDVIEALFAGDLGKLHLLRDPCGRFTHIHSAYYTALYDKYDATGELCHYSYVDEQGAVDVSCSYDELNQLIAENDHTYSFDSLYNRIRKDGVTTRTNALNQIVEEGFVYDTNGNLVKTPDTAFCYDSQDRLVEMRRGDMKVVYTYDAFHRRLSKTVYEKGYETKKQRFLWDGQNEIGAVTERGKIEELRVLGEGLGAELGAAVLLEIQGRTYVPFHDNRGALVTVVDVATKKSTALRFTAFGEELSARTPIPWGFASKRLDTETGFLFFGRRYYSPQLAKWITADPKGFDDGPNLYAYVHNNPLTHFDLYGLADHGNRGLLNFIFEAIRDNWREGAKRRDHGCTHLCPEFENEFKAKSNIKDAGGRSFFGLFLGFINGINTQEKEAEGHAEYASSLAGESKIRCIWNANHGKANDAREYCSNTMKGKVTGAGLRLIEEWKEFYKNYPGWKYLMLCHSQGVALVKNALIHSSEEIRKMVIVLAVAPGAYISKHLCLEVVHLVSKRDLVPYLDLKGRFRCADTIRKLDPHPNAPFFDHSFQSPTYEIPIQRYIYYFSDKYRVHE